MHHFLLQSWHQVGHRPNRMVLRYARSQEYDPEFCRCHCCASGSLSVSRYRMPARQRRCASSQCPGLGAPKNAAPKPCRLHHQAAACTDATPHPQRGHRRTTSCRSRSVRSRGTSRPHPGETPWHNRSRSSLSLSRSPIDTALIRRTRPCCEP